MTNVLLTGATGFVGSALLEKLGPKYKVDLLVRKPVVKTGSKVFVGEINPIEDYTEALDGKDVVVHCAARVHVMKEAEGDPLSAFRSVNTLGTKNLAMQAAKAGVKKFIFISSIKVNGEETFKQPFLFSDVNNPQDYYGQSKAEAEDTLLDIARNTGIEVIIIRPPLIYGRGVKANFGALINLVQKGFPLPFGAITENRRSMVYIGNLVDLVDKAIEFPKTANQIYLVSDDFDLSTNSLIMFIAQGLNKRVLNLPFPVSLFSLFGKLFGKQDVVSRLTGSLQVDIEKTKTDFAWTPPFTCRDGIAETTKSFKCER